MVEGISTGKDDWTPGNELGVDSNDSLEELEEDIGGGEVQAGDWPA